MEKKRDTNFQAFCHGPYSFKRLAWFFGYFSFFGLIVIVLAGLVSFVPASPAESSSPPAWLLILIMLAVEAVLIALTVWFWKRARKEGRQPPPDFDLRKLY